MPGSAPIRPPTTRWSAGTAVISRKQTQHPERAQDRERGGRGRERDPHDGHVEDVPPVAKEGGALHHEAGKNLDHKNGDDDAIDQGKQRAEAGHHGLRWSRAQESRR